MNSKSYAASTLSTGGARGYVTCKHVGCEGINAAGMDGLRVRYRLEEPELEH